MKIDIDFILSKVPAGTEGNKTKNLESGNFSDVLAQAVSEQVQRAKVIEEARSTQAVAPVSDSSLPPLWFKVKGLLDILDEYSQNLGNAKNSLKDLEPLIDEMEDQIQGIDGDIDIENSDPLNGLAQQVLAQTQAEVIKYRRGDYV